MFRETSRRIRITIGAVDHSEVYVQHNAATSRLESYDFTSTWAMRFFAEAAVRTQKTLTLLMLYKLQWQRRFKGSCSSFASALIMRRGIAGEKSQLRDGGLTLMVHGPAAGELQALWTVGTSFHD